MTFSKKYFILTILLFLVEVFIAVFMKDNFVRPYVGDVLVVILIYAFVRSFLRIEVCPALLFVLLFSVLIEFFQYINIVETLHLESNSIARTVIGTSFSWFDILCYFAGVAITGAVEHFRTKGNSS